MDIVILVDVKQPDSVFEGAHKCRSYMCVFIGLGVRYASLLGLIRKIILVVYFIFRGK
jgi:hypothetical protein